MSVYCPACLCLSTGAWAHSHASAKWTAMARTWLLNQRPPSVTGLEMLAEMEPHQTQTKTPKPPDERQASNTA